MTDLKRPAQPPSESGSAWRHACGAEPKPVELDAADLAQAVKDAEQKTCTRAESAPLTMQEKRQLLQELAETYRPQLVRWLAKHYTHGDWMLAEDMAQEAFTATLHYLPNVRRPGKAFLQECAKNCLNTYYRKQRQMAAPLQDTLPLGRQDHNIEYVEAKVDVLRILDRLRAEDRRVCELRYLYDMGYEEIARTLSISVGTVKSRLHRCRQIALMFR